MAGLYLTTKEVAETFGIPVRTLELWREKRRGPVFYRIGKRVFYKAEELELYISSRAVQPEVNHGAN